MVVLNPLQNHPTVSVIIPTWNRKDVLKRAIESVLAQEGVSLEVLVCDDGSTDGSVEMVESWQDPRVRLISGPRAGKPAIPRNRGIAAASGEWLAFLDDDDEWLPGKLSAQLAFATKRGYWAVTTNALRVQPGHNEALPYHIQSVPERCDFATLLSLNYVITSSAFVHSFLFEKVMGFPETIFLTVHEDYALWLRISSITPFGYLEKPYVRYTDAPAQSIRRLGDGDRKFKFRVYCNWIYWAGWKILSRNGLAALRRISQAALPERLYSKACGLWHRCKSFLSV
jgi:glycosyltransferase involved in cell wall biosynthesis